MKLGIIYQTMTAEGIASLRKVGMFCKASLENPVQVFAQVEENLTQSPNNSTLIQ